MKKNVKTLQKQWLKITLENKFQKGLKKAKYRKLGLKN